MEASTSTASARGNASSAGGVGGVVGLAGGLLGPVGLVGRVGSVGLSMRAAHWFPLFAFRFELVDLAKSGNVGDSTGLAKCPFSCPDPL